MEPSTMSNLEKCFQGHRALFLAGANVIALALCLVSARAQSAEQNCTVVTLDATVPHDSDTDDRNIPDHADAGTDIACVPAIVPAAGTPTASPAASPKKPAVSAA